MWLAEFQTGFITTLATKFSAWDTSMYVATAPTITAGRIFIKSWTTKEWIKFTGVTPGTPAILTGCIRQLDTTTDPAVSLGNGYTFLAGTQITFVAMGDQLTNSKNSNIFTWNNTFSGTNTFTGEVDLSNVSDFNVLGKSNPYPVVVDVTARDVLYPSPVTGDGAIVESTNTLDIYSTGLANWQHFAVTTSIVDASTTVKGIVEEATVAEVGNQTATGGTWARLFINPTATLKTSSGAADENYIPVLNASGKLASGFIDYIAYILNIFGAWEDGDVVISSNTSLTGDKYYNSLTINNGFVLSPAWYRIFVKWELINNGTIRNNGSNGSTWGNAVVGSGWGGWAAGTAASSWTLGATYAGWAGGGGWSFNNGAGGAGGANSTNTALGIGVIWLVGWTWWSWSGGAGGWGGWTWTYTNPKTRATTLVNSLIYRDIVDTNSIFIWSWSSGWGGWGRGAANNWAGSYWGGGWGWGGSAGWSIFIAARKITNNWTIEANGGNGWLWGNSTWSGIDWWGNGGWGSWGSGGVITLIYASKTTWTITVTWGTKWAHGTGWYANGVDGSDGSVWVINNIPVIN